MKRVLHWFIYGSSKKLNALEVACLDCWKSNLPKDAVLLLDQQLQHLKFVSRQLKGKLTVFSPYDVSFCWPKEFLFPLGGQEAVVFRLTIKVMLPDQEKRIKAEIHLFSGRFCSIRFNMPLKNVRAGDYEILDCNVLADVLCPSGSLPVSRMAVQDLPDCIKDITNEGYIDARKALSEEKINEKIKQLDVFLPPDYLDILKHADGIETESYELHGLSNAWQLPQEDADYLILVMIKGNGYIGVQRGNKDGALFYIDNINDEIQSLGNSIAIAIKGKCTSSG
jgi:hypothetical protein